MKSHLKIIPFVTLILLLSAQVKGAGYGIGYLTIDQDSTNFNNKLRVDSFALPIIAPSSGVHFFRDKIMFLSLTKNESKMTPNHISFGSVDTYLAPILDSVTGFHSVFSTYFPFSFPVEGVTFNHSYDTIYFTKLADNDKEKIFMAKYSSAGKPGITGGIAPLEFCKGNYNYSHPTLSADGKTMIFASDNEGSLGGMDLFVTRRKNYGWTIPENLGNLINTHGNEFFPFLDQDNNLFYSSDGLKGFGGYDVFTCKFNGKGWNKPVNLSNSINSKYDDIAFTINTVDSKSAFFTRKSGKNEMQLLLVRVKKDNNNLTAIFNGSHVPVTLTAEATKEEKMQTAKVAPAVTNPETKTEKKPEKKTTTVNAVAKNTPQKSEAVTQPSAKKAVTEVPAQTSPQKSAPVAQPPVKKAVTEVPAGTSDSKFVKIKLSIPTPDNQKDVVIFRIQITSSDKPKKEKEIAINGKNYPLFEYYYLGAYRYCIGEFTTLQSAVELQNMCRKSVYTQAFVTGFKNDTRVMDLKSFK